MYMQTLTGVVSGVIVAIFWVVLGNWLQSRVKQIRTLRGLRSEVKNNKELYGFILGHVNSELDEEVEDLHSIPMMEQFSREAYENAKASGSLDKLSMDLRNLLFQHYDSLGFANRQIGGRERWKIDGQHRENYREMAMRLDRAILGTLLYIRPEESEEISQDKIEPLSQNYSEEDYKVVTRQKEPDPNIDFTSLENQIKSNLEQYRVLTTLI